MRGAVPILALLVLATFPAAQATTSCGSSGPANDCFADSVSVDGRDAWHSNAGATMEPGEPAPCGNVGKTVWFTLMPVRSGAIVVSGGTGFSGVLAAYTGDALSGLALLACDTEYIDEDFGVHPPALWLSCAAGVPIRLQAGGMSGESGAFPLSFEYTQGGCAFAPTLPSEPQFFDVEGRAERILVDWYKPYWDGGNAVNVSHYVVYRAEGSCLAPFAQHATVTHVEFQYTFGIVDRDLPNDATYCYHIAAVNSVGEGPSTMARAGTTWGPPRPPASVTVSPGPSAGDLSLTWTRSVDENWARGQFLGYRLYRWDASAGEFVQVGSVNYPAATFSEGGFGNGATRCYRVSSVSVMGEGPPSDAFCGTTYVPPGAPRNVAARSAATAAPPFAIDVTWTAAAGQGIQRYLVYRSTDPEDIGTLAGSVSWTQRRFTDTGRLPLTAYYYAVVAENPAGPGAPSDRACGTSPITTFFEPCG